MLCTNRCYCIAVIIACTAAVHGGNFCVDAVRVDVVGNGVASVASVAVHGDTNVVLLLWMSMLFSV